MLDCLGLSAWVLRPGFTASVAARVVQACILAVGGTDKKVVPNEGPDAATKPFVTKSVMMVSLSADHR